MMRSARVPVAPLTPNTATEASSKELEEFSGFLDAGEWDGDEVAATLQILISRLGGPLPDPTRSAIFGVLNRALIKQHNLPLRLDTMVTEIEKLPPLLLAKAIEVIGNSGQDKFLPALEEYVDHAHDAVQTAAQQAIQQLR